MILKELKKYFGRNNFEHRQRSVYCSKENMRVIDVLILLEKLSQRCSWLKNCLKRMDVTDVGELHELTDLIKQDIN